MRTSKLWFSGLALGSLVMASSGIQAEPPTRENSFASSEAYTVADGCDYLADQAPGATFALYFPDREERLVCNSEAAERRVLPASTFKIAHALIALETGAIKDEFKKEDSDGRERIVSSWNQPTSLATGMANSTVWFYQRVAERVGVQGEREWLKRLNYGNADMGASDELTTFWLTGSLRISALEQIIFLDLLSRRGHEASTENQDRVANMMVVGRGDEGSGGTLYAKSGAVLPIGETGDIEQGESAEILLEGVEEVGWYVGWVAQPEEDGGDAVFALQLPMRTKDALAKRQALSLDMLRINGVELDFFD
ncbi:penicillin-binding transpeptidase domain-containing protein [Gilvimarinus sp. F26214L]|uniref:penicillin-binding transpeptidase domain-containing protein n=1 Tax=Gilvimarinus sp. DZF01 TaxID=3461371 RepID=UPI0040466FCE